MRKTAVYYEYADGILLRPGKDADYLIYNSTIDGELQTLDDLLAKANCWRNLKQFKMEMCGVRRKIFFRKQQDCL